MKKWVEKQGKYEDWQVEDVGNGYAIYHKEVNQEWRDSRGDNLLFETEGEARLYLRKAFEKEPTEQEVFDALDRAGIPFDLIRIEEGLREIAVCVEEVRDE
jgi:hypothetical protein